MLKESVETALEEIRPALQADGGDVELVDVTDDGRGDGEAHRRLPRAAPWGCRR